jgi:Fe-S oxidoreductase
MCPSYQATHDEQHSTRGRANALRLAITGQLGKGGLTDPALFEVLDLCLECKACKSECPTNVDMARLKAEFLHQYYRKHGLPWRSRVFGNVARLSRWGCRLAPVSNWIAQSRLGRWLNERFLGIDRRRIPPAFARRTLLHDRGAIHSLSTCLGGHTRSPMGVLLFLDTFTNYQEPAIGREAVAILQHAGCPAFVGRPPDPGPGEPCCCGRPLISNGMLSHAVEHARCNVEHLFPWADRGGLITACEPSCLLTLKDDYPSLLRGDLRERAEAVAKACLTFEEFLEKLAVSGDMHFRAGPKKILVQGHCHQRSLVGMEATLRLLRRIPGAEVIDLDAGCCGLAGSFGYEREHYEVSRLVGEQRLFPALRQAEADAVVVASGFSCRRQIEQFTGRKALHPAQLLNSLIQPSSA